MLSDISEVLSRADCLWSNDQLQPVYDRLAQQISADMSDNHPLVLCVMNGGVFLTAELLRRMNFLLELDYIHVTRYQNNTEGGHMDWVHFPAEKIRGRNILIIDDILDIGITIKEILAACHDAKAASVKSVVLTDKQHERRIKGVEVDYIGVEVADRFVFGCGMDYKGYYRNLDAIYALAD